MNSIRDLIADDSYAISFQSMGQYRTALLKALDSDVEPRETPSVQEIDKVFEDNCYTDDYGTYLMQKEDFRDGVRVALSRWGRPTAPLAPVETPSDEDLLAMRSWSSYGHTFDSDLVDFGRRCYNLGRQHGAAKQ